MALIDKLSAIGDAIRAKTGKADKLTLDQMPTEIASIEMGGGNEWVGDGKTRLYIKIAAEGRMDIPLYFSQTVANGVTIDWGDGSALQTLSGTGKMKTTHTYASIGEYCISLDVADGCMLGLGHNSSSYCVMGSISDIVYCNMLKKIEIGRGVTKLEDYAFYNCYSLTSIKIPSSVTSFGSYVFYYCHSLESVTIPNSITTVGRNIFYSCYSLASVTIPEGISAINNYTFYNCYSLASFVIPKNIVGLGTYVFSGCKGIKFYDFTKHTAVPTLANTNAFANISSDCEIRVPSALYDEWIAATNWSAYASYIVAVQGEQNDS